MLETSPRWNRQRLAVLEAVDFDLKRAFSVLYFISVASALTYMVGWLRFNLLDLPVGPPSYYTFFTLGLTALAGALFSLLLPAVAVAFGVEQMLQRRIRLMDETAVKAAGHRSIALKSLPQLNETVGGTYERHHHPQP